MFQIWLDHQQAQLDWVRKHPFKWVFYNLLSVAIVVAIIRHVTRDIQPIELENEPIEGEPRKKVIRVDF